MKLLLDSDILLDIALDRAPFFDESNAIIRSCQQYFHAGVLVWHTVANLYYVLHAARGGASGRRFILGLIQFCAVARCSTDAIRHALTLTMADFEDALQVAAGHAESAQFIITRNIADYTGSPLPAITPHDFLRRFPIS